MAKKRDVPANATPKINGLPPEQRVVKTVGATGAGLSDAEIDATFQALNDRHNNIYQFVMRYNDYILSVHDYGEGTPLTMIEAHTLTYIEENPGATVTELARYWGKTKGALSQTVARLTNWGLVSKERAADNARIVRLVATDKGVKLSRMHKLYDTADIAKTMGELGRECSTEEIDAFFKVLSVYNKVIERDFEINKGHQRGEASPARPPRQPDQASA